jgi:hypothetical protein
MENAAWLCWLCDGELCERCGNEYGHCAHPEPALDQIDSLWDTADAAKHAELREMVHGLALRYGKRVPLSLRAPKARESN